MNDIDIPMDRFEVSEIRVSDIAGDKLRILRKVKAEQGRHSNHSVTVADRLVACVIGRMNDQQLAMSPKLIVQTTDHRSIQRGDSIRLVPTVSGDQHPTCASR